MQSLLGDRFRYLLDVFEYDQSLYPGPPHSVKLDEIKQLYGNFLALKMTHVCFSLPKREFLFNKKTEPKCKIQMIDSVRVDSPVPLGPALVEDNRPYENVFLLSNH